MAGVVTTISCACGTIARVQLFPLRCSCGRIYRNATDHPSEPTKSAAQSGVGTELRKILGCTCRMPIARLDEWGPDKCLAEFDAIVAEMVHLSAKHKQPISTEASQRMLRIAIERARVTSTSGCRQT